ncbi:MAG: ABC transporter ATP-binding protein [Proteobacteria bacterium]|nr:ABC transporter ATP-binding protein [Pseudomonadota bacterium]MCP4917320.1 ABC transporter ATP-binding protein [Pseudomonadota bacterium]
MQTRGLEKIYRSGFFRIPYTGLENLDLDVRPGESFGFIGPNGAGKTTTIKILMGLQSATAGTATILGQDHRDPESRRKVGFLPERPYFYQYLTATEFLKFYGSLFDLGGATLTRRIGELLERVGLDRFADVKLGSFSKGMLQRAGVAQALINDPELVVMDEPMSGLDPMGRALIRDLILEERAAGRTVFFSSHILADVEVICDRIAIVVKGKLRGCGTIDELVGHGVRHVDIRYAGGLLEGTEGTVQHTESDRVLLRVDHDHVDTVVDVLRAAGRSIRSVEPVKMHLEDLFLDEVERAEKVDSKRMGVLA